MAFSQMPYKRQKNKKLSLNSGIQTYQILTNDEVCIPSFSSILLAVIIQATALLRDHSYIT